MFRLSTVALLGAEAVGSNVDCPAQDEASLLQMPVVQNTLDATDSECRCPGYYQEECEAEAAQGCIWSSAGTSNSPWCQCDESVVPPPFVPGPTVEPLPPVVAPLQFDQSGTNNWCGTSNNDFYTQTSSSRSGWNLDTSSNGGWRWCGITADECQTECTGLGDCQEIYWTPNSCCFPSRAVCNTGSHAPGGAGGMRYIVVPEVEVKGPCSDYFGDMEGVVTVADPDVGHTSASSPYCEGNGMSSPCIYMHLAGPANECQSPGPPDGCHRYHTVKYSECSELDAFNAESRIDTTDAFDTEGVFKLCADRVISNEVNCYGPPADLPQACDCSLAGPEEPASPWALIVQYGNEAYPANSDAVGVVNAREVRTAKRSDADINALHSGGDAAYDYYMLTSDSETSGVSDSMILRTTESYDDLSSDFGWGSYAMCVDSTSSVADCTQWTTHGHSRIDSIAEDGNDCDRWFSGYNGIMCYGHSGVASSREDHCFSHGNSCSLGSHAIRTNLKMFKYTGEGFVDEEPEPEEPDTSSTWTLIVQYASEAYPANSDAVGVVSDIENAVAKLSDADINALPSGGDAAYDYYMLTSDSDTQGVSDSMILRTTESYDDLSSDFGWGSYAMCIDSTSSVADCTQWNTHGHSRIDSVAEDGNDCDRWFSGYNGIMCYGHSGVASSREDHCFSHGNSCSLGSHAIRTNMRMYKFTRGA